MATDERAKQAKRIKALMSEHGLSQRELARRIGGKQQYISRYASGSQAIPIRDAKRIAAEFGVYASWVMGLDDAEQAVRDMATAHELIRVASSCRDEIDRLIKEGANL